VRGRFGVHLLAEFQLQPGVQIPHFTVSTVLHIRLSENIELKVDNN
jgi:hypothetical protein